LWLAGTAFWATIVAVIALRHVGLDEAPTMTTFGVIFASIVVEALPFILLGALVSAAMAVYVPDSAFERLARLPRSVQVPGAALAGIAFPVCECGSVPVARRLIVRGLHPSAALGFMLAAPIFNPVVIASTWVAYGGGRLGAEMVAGRCGLGLVIAMAAGVLIGGRSLDLLRPRAGDSHPARSHDGNRTASFVGHLTGDFLFMGKFLVLGAALSALLQTLVPQTVISGIAGTPLLGTLALMGLAFMLSLCSEADAFVATSFTAFSPASQLGFLVLGPMADVKLAALYAATFRHRFLLRLLGLAVPLTLAGSLVFGVWVR
jgi:uncharacterized membrane protein YraQ (UPF0718 family)